MKGSTLKTNVMVNQTKPSNYSKIVRDFQTFHVLLGCHLTSVGTCGSAMLLRHPAGLATFTPPAETASFFIMCNIMAVFPVISLSLVEEQNTHHCLLFSSWKTVAADSDNGPLKTTMSSEFPIDPSIPTITVSKDV